MKTIVFWLLKRNGKVYTEIVPDVKAKTLIPIITWKTKIEDTESNYPPPKGVALAKRPYKGLDRGSKLEERMLVMDS